MDGLHGLHVWRVFMCGWSSCVEGLRVDGLHVWRVFMCGGSSCVDVNRD